MTRAWRIIKAGSLQMHLAERARGFMVVAGTVPA